SISNKGTVRPINGPATYQGQGSFIAFIISFIYKTNSSFIYPCLFHTFDFSFPHLDTSGEVARAQSFLAKDGTGSNAAVSAAAVNKVCFLFVEILHPTFKIAACYIHVDRTRNSAHAEFLGGAHIHDNRIRVPADLFLKFSAIHVHIGFNPVKYPKHTFLYLR